MAIKIFNDVGIDVLLNDPIGNFSEIIKKLKENTSLVVLANSFGNL